MAVQPLFYGVWLPGFVQNSSKHFCAVPISIGGARGVMVIVVGNGHGDKSSNPR